MKKVLFCLICVFSLNIQAKEANCNANYYRGTNFIGMDSPRGDNTDSLIVVGGGSYRADLESCITSHIDYTRDTDITKIEIEYFLSDGQVISTEINDLNGEH